MPEINWTAPDKDSTYDQTLVYRATSKYGTFSLIATLTDIRTTKYVDNAGTSASWGKIRWYDSVNVVYSPYSDPIPYTGTVSDTNYSTPKMVAQFLNNYRLVTAEALGTGDAATTVFGPVADPKMVADSETVYVATVKKKRNTDYTIDYETGKVTFASAPASSAALTIDYWGNTQLLNSHVIEIIKRAEDEVNRRTGRTFYQPQTITEYIDSFDPLDTILHTYLTDDFTGDMRTLHSQTAELLTSRQLKLEKYPLTSVSQVIINAQPTTITAEAVGTGAGVVTAFTLANSPVVYGSEIVYVAGTQSTAYTIDCTTGIITFTSAPTGAITCDYIHCSGGTVIGAADYILKSDPGVILLKTTVSQIKKNMHIATVTYAYGYNEVPASVRDLATTLAAITLMQSTLLGSTAPLSVVASNLGVLLGRARSLLESLGTKLEVTRL